MKLARRIFLIILFLLLLFNFLFWLLAIASGHTIPTGTTRSILTTALILIILMVLTYKYRRPKGTE